MVMDKGGSVDKPLIVNEGQSLICRNCGEHWPKGQLECPVCGHHLFEAKDTGEMNGADGHKADNGKLRYDLIPTWPLEQLAAVMTYGATTYGDHNWRRGMKYHRLYTAAQRHINAFWAGEDIDRDSGLPHLAHAAANMLMLLEFARRGYDGIGMDDRLVEGLRAEDIRAMVQAGAI